MKILLSPAKIMGLNTQNQWKKKTSPLFIEDSAYLQSYLKEFSPSELENMLEISPKLSRENWERNQQWKSNPSKQECIQAIFAFKGEVYRGLETETLSSNSLSYLEKNIFILSGLYGILKPSNLIMLYRLEMGKKLQTEKCKNLYSFWTNKLTEHVNSQLKGKEPIINLASKEYFKALDYKNIKSPIIDVDFKDYKNGKLKSIMMHFKNARGKMTRWCADNNIQKIEDLKNFREANYAYSEELSVPNHLVFVR